MEITDFMLETQHGESISLKNVKAVHFGEIDHYLDEIQPKKFLVVDNSIANMKISLEDVNYISFYLVDEITSIAVHISSTKEKK